jgi:hypothetical protein
MPGPWPPGYFNVQLLDLINATEFDQCTAGQSRRSAGQCGEEWTVGQRERITRSSRVMARVCGVAGLVALGVTAAGVGHARSRVEERKRHRRELETYQRVIAIMASGAATAPVGIVPAMESDPPDQTVGSGMEDPSIVTRLPSPEILRAARELARDVIAAEERRAGRPD